LEEELQPRIESLEHNGYEPIAPDRSISLFDRTSKLMQRASFGARIKRYRHCWISTVNCGPTIAGMYCQRSAAFRNRVPQARGQWRALSRADQVRVQPHFEDAVWCTWSDTESKGDIANYWA